MEKKEYWITNSRFKFIAILLLIIFLVFMSLLFLKGYELASNPCSLCAEKLNENVICVSENTRIIFSSDGNLSLDPL